MTKEPKQPLNYNHLNIIKSWYKSIKQLLLGGQRLMYYATGAHLFVKQSKQQHKISLHLYIRCPISQTEKRSLSLFVIK